MNQKIIILDFGSQTTQLIGRRIRELNVFCEIMPYNRFPADDPDIIGVILSGSPYSVYDKEAFKVDYSQFLDRWPVLGICYGAQLTAETFGGKWNLPVHVNTDVPTSSRSSQRIRSSVVSIRAVRYGCPMVTLSHVCHRTIVS